MKSRLSVTRASWVAAALALTLAVVGCSTPQASRVAAVAAPSALPTSTTPTPTRTSTTAPSASATTRMTTKPKPAPSSASGRPNSRPAPFRFPVPVAVGNATQVVTVVASGSYATVTAWQTRVGDQTVSGLPNSSGTVGSPDASGLTTVTITWHPASRKSTEADSKYVTQVMMP